MIETIPFQTRARTIDHLGREQIADCPTAISELWKNSYDAYARNVELHVFDGIIPIAAVLDDGHGMNKDEFLNKWLIVGTDSKTSDKPVDEMDRNGLPQRIKQGQKGIGRLSSGIMGSMLLLISKRRNCDFVAAMVDWRVFENPFLMLSDVNIPVYEFSNKDSIIDMIPKMFDALFDNVDPKDKESDRGQRIVSAWSSYSNLEKDHNKKHLSVDVISESMIESNFTPNHFEKWDVWNGRKKSGTALFVADINDELASLIRYRYSEDDYDQARKDHVFKTLSSFFDPFSPQRDINKFNYQVISWRDSQSHNILESDHEFSQDSFEDLEHYIDGIVDTNGIFHGTVKAFGECYDKVEIVPPSNFSMNSRSQVGTFKVSIGTFEGNRIDSTLNDEMHAFFKEQSMLYSGLNVHRDDLRVLPYGRPDSDFFEIDERRSRHAGREFWVHRQVFGRIAISRQTNPNLKDKAGREGLIDNRARQNMKRIVVELLKSASRTYFGTDSEIRKQKLPEIQLKNESVARGKAKQAKRSNIKLFVKTLKLNQSILNEYLDSVRYLENRLGESINAENLEEVNSCQEKINDLCSEINALKINNPPSRLNAYENEFYSYIENLKELSFRLNEIKSKAISFIEEHKIISPEKIIFSVQQRHAKVLHDQIRKWKNEILTTLNRIKSEIDNYSDNANKLFHAGTINFVSAFENGAKTFTETLDEMDFVRDNLFATFSEFYEPYLRSLNALSEGIDLDTAVNFSSDESERLQEDLNKFTSLAQLGITVELIAHEMDRLEHTTQRQLRLLPLDIQDLPAFKDAWDSHQELLDKIKFLSPLKLSGVKYSRTSVTGRMILNYVSDFFKERLKQLQINLHATKAFNDFSVMEYRSRLYPVFINLVNNAIYWVSQKSRSNNPEILLDYDHGKVFVADNGPGVPLLDIKELFRLFFSRRQNGRGVGLYLCKTNLELGKHEIYYAVDDAEKRLSGANFVIKFEGVENE